MSQVILYEESDESSSAANSAVISDYKNPQNDN